MKHSILDILGVCLLCSVLFLMKPKAPQRKFKFHSGFISSSHVGFTILKLKEINSTYIQVLRKTHDRSTSLQIETVLIVDRSKQKITEKRQKTKQKQKQKQKKKKKQKTKQNKKLQQKNKNWKFLKLNEMGTYGTFL